MEAVLPLLGQKFKETEVKYKERDVAIYTLGIGSCGKNALDPLELPYVHERPSIAAQTGSSMKVFPTFGVLLMGDIVLALRDVPGMAFDPALLLHAEQELEIMQPIPSHGHMRSHLYLAGLEDKGKAALVTVESRTFDTASGNLICINKAACFLRGAGGFSKAHRSGGDSASVSGRSVEVTHKAQLSKGQGSRKAEAISKPNRYPDFLSEELIPESQALLYRLSGDYNPLHADPAFATSAGFSRPILHGLCTLGFATRAVVQSICRGNADAFVSLRMRFLSHVFPGETLVTEMWGEEKEGGGAGDGGGGGRGSTEPRTMSVVVRCRVKERNVEVLAGVMRVHVDFTSRL